MNAILKKGFLLGGALLLVLTSSYGQTKATSADEKAVRATVDALVNSWNAHDYSDMSTYTTPDADWVNIVGMWWKGRDAVQKAHQAYHESIFKASPLSTASVRVRFVTPEVAIVHHITNMAAFTTPGGRQMPGAQNLATLVLVKQRGKWLLTAGQNVPIDASAARHDPVRVDRY